MRSSVISILKEQKAFRGLIFPAPGPLPLPQPPWQQKHTWERVLEWSIKPGCGGGAITCPQRSGPACSTPHGLHLFTNSHQFSAAAPTGFHFVPFHPAMSQPPPPYSSPSQPCILMRPSQHLFSGPWTVRLLAQGPREGATEGSGHPNS